MLLVAGCGPHYWVRGQAAPTGWMAARQDPDGAVVAVRPAELRDEGAREDGARYLGRRLTRPKRFTAGLALVAIGVPLVAFGLGFGLEAIGQDTHDGAVNRGVGFGFAAAGGAATATGIALLSWAWPPRPACEPIAAHPELVEPPPPLDLPSPSHR